MRHAESAITNDLMLTGIFYIFTKIVSQKTAYMLARMRLLEKSHM